MEQQQQASTQAQDLVVYKDTNPNENENKKELTVLLNQPINPAVFNKPDPIDPAQLKGWKVMTYEQYMRILESWFYRTFDLNGHVLAYQVNEAKFTRVFAYFCCGAIWLEDTPGHVIPSQPTDTFLVKEL